jgi:hypothetical protein
MCQGCVDEGRLSQEVYDKIEAFLEKYPDAEYGPAHIVLADDNLLDGHILWCIGLAKAAIYRDPKYLVDPDEDVELMRKLDWYGDQPIGCLYATIEILEELLKIPEDDR